MCHTATRSKKKISELRFTLPDRAALLVATTYQINKIVEPAATKKLLVRISSVEGNHTDQGGPQPLRR